MIRMLVPIVMAILGTGAGVGAGFLLAPAPEVVATASQTESATQPASEETPHEKTGAPTEGPTDFVALNNQFVVPIIEGERIGAMVVVSLSIEVEAGDSQAVYSQEPKLRDGFLQVLFDHANRGGFEGEFTNANNMDVLRRMLSEVASDVLGPVARGVLITEIARQDT